MKKVRKFLAMLLILMPATVRGQSVVDDFDPNPNGTPRIVVVQPDGKILVGGHFTAVRPNGGAAVTRNHIARLNPDGTLDTLFNPNANNVVYSIAVQADGKILAGGQFSSIGGQMRNRIARLDATTGLADSFDPNASLAVNSIVVQADGKILVGGQFPSIGGQSRHYLARLDATTGLVDSSFSPAPDSFVYSIAVQTEDKILAIGGFSTIGGQTRRWMARLDATTGLADGFNPNPNSVVRTIAVQADGKILAGGDFSGMNSIGGQPRNRIARLDATTGLADSFDPSADGTVYSIAAQADGKILAGGFFNSVGGQPRNRLARLDALTGLADSLDPNVDWFVYSIAVQADGKILAGGAFSNVSGQTRHGLARLEPGTPTPSTLGNISTRLQVGAADRVMIAGFIVQGSAPKRVLIRAAGPSLTQFGVPNALANPRLELHNSASTIGMNDDWQTTQIGGVTTADQVVEIQGSGLAPSDPAESALIATLPPGSYTAIVQGVNDGTGVGIVEVYDLNAVSGSLLANISTRGFVETGDNAMIGGFIVVTQPTRVIIRAIGPSLTPFGVPDALSNPQLELHDASSTIGQNDDWQTTQIGGIITSDQVAEIQNSQLAPTNSAESAIIATLQPGSYTATVRGAAKTMGNALVEVYALP